MDLSKTMEFNNFGIEMIRTKYFLKKDFYAFAIS